MGVGRVIKNRYRLVEPIGRGGFGEVWAAERTDRPEQVAIKLIDRHAAVGSEAITRFLREARVNEDITHPAILQVFDSGIDEGQPYLVSELLLGHSLAQVFEDAQLSPRDRVGLVARALEPLAAAHAAGVIHRDLKPSNIFKTMKSVKLLDFGLARQLGEVGVTRTGIAMGTTDYASPEQIQDAKRAGTAADVWSMGAILFEAVAGHPPFRAKTPSAVLAKIVTERAPRLVGEHPALTSLIADCLERDASKRPTDAQVLQRRLSRVLESWASWAKGVQSAPTLVGGPGSAPTLTKESMGRAPTLAADGLGPAPTLAADRLGSAPTLAADGLGSAPTLAADRLGSAPTLAADGLGHAPTLAADRLGSAPTLAADGLGSAHRPAVGSAATLAAGGLELPAPRPDSSPASGPSNAANEEIEQSSEAGSVPLRLPRWLWWVLPVAAVASAGLVVFIADQLSPEAPEPAASSAPVEQAEHATAALPQGAEMPEFETTQTIAEAVAANGTRPPGPVRTDIGQRSSIPIEGPLVPGADGPSAEAVRPSQEQGSEVDGVPFVTHESAAVVAQMRSPTTPPVSVVIPPAAMSANPVVVPTPTVGPATPAAPSMSSAPYDPVRDGLRGARQTGAQPAPTAPPANTRAEQAQLAVRAQSAMVDLCRRTGPTRVRGVFLANGQVTAVSVSTPGDHACIVRAVSRASLPASAGPPTTFDHTFPAR